MKTLAGFVLITLLAVAAPAQDGSRARTAVIRGMELPYEVIAGYAVHAGDIILGTAEEVAGWDTGGARSTLAVPSGYRPSGLFCTWPDGIIPYVIDDNVPRREEEEVRKAIRTWDTQTILRFVKRAPHHEHYLRFTLGAIPGRSLSSGTIAT